MCPPETSYPTTTSPEYSNTFEAQNVKTNFMEMIDVFNEEMNKSLKKPGRIWTSHWNK